MTRSLLTAAAAALRWPTQWFRSKRQPAVRRPVFKPMLEGLEERLTPTVAYHGGPLLSNVAVQGLYIGDQWITNSTLFSQRQYLEGFLKTVVNSSYMDTLTNAGYKVARGSFTPGTVSGNTLAAGSTLTDSYIQSMLASDISAGLLQPVSSNSLYVCFIEPNIMVKSFEGTTSAVETGHHYAFKTANGSVVRYAVVNYPGGTVNNASFSFLSAIDTMTTTASHEIAESATDPDHLFGTTAWFDDENNGEIGDIPAGHVMYIKGYAMQELVNQNDLLMTPSQATSDRAVSFMLRSDGIFVEVVNGVANDLLFGMSSISAQGIDSHGHAMVDVMNSSGYAWEFHDTGAGGTTVYLGSGIKSAVAGQRVSFLLYNTGNVYMYVDDTAQTFYYDGGVSAIDAGYASTDLITLPPV
jgi:hypothetical protein